MISQKHIALCCDDNFAIPSIICLISLFENNQEGEIVAHIVSNEISKQNLCRFEQLSKEYGHPVIVHLVDSSRLETLHVEGRYSNNVFLRYLLPELVDTDRILYLDGDTIVRHDISALWDLDMEDYACGVVEDEDGDEILKYNRIGISNPYFNSGVLLMNLDYWRKNNLFDKLVEFIVGNPEKCKFPDQDALNALLPNKVLWLDYRYNFQHLWFQASRPIHLRKEKWPDIEEAGKDPIIVHFCTEVKPWHKECNCKYQEEFLHYANLHTFVGFKVCSMFSTLYNVLSIPVEFFTSLRYKLTGNK